jgi:hypothetical protein
MKSLWMAAVLAGALAGCSQGSGQSEEAMATKIVDAGGVLNLDDETLKQVVSSHVQQIAFERPNLAPAQADEVAKAIRANIDAALPELEKKIVAQLVEALEPKELEALLAFVSVRESVTEKMGLVSQQSLAAADEMTVKAVEKAVADAKLPPPVDPNAPAVPGVLKPNNPQQ